MQIFQPGSIPSLMIGNQVFTDLTNLIIMATQAGSSQRGTFRSVNGSSGRAVTNGKTLTIWAARTIENTVSAGSGSALCYSDNDVGLNSATALTNPVYYFGNSGNTAMTAVQTAGSYKEVGGIGFQVPAGKYPGINNPASIAVQITAYGYEA